MSFWYSFHSFLRIDIDCNSFAASMMILQSKQRVTRKKRIFQYIECSKWQTVVNVVEKSKIPLDNDIYMLRAIILNWLISSKVFAGMWNIYPLSLLLLSQVFYLIKRKNEDFFYSLNFAWKMCKLKSYTFWAALFRLSCFQKAIYFRIYSIWFESNL